jgi:DNA primase
MPTIPDHTLEDIRERVDMVELIGRHVGLKRSGKQFKGLCPFHREKTPSFYVDPNRKSYKCFGCGEWGDAIDFLRKVEGKGFVEAVRTLAGMTGVALPRQDERQVAQARERETQRDRAYTLNALAERTYREILSTAQEGAAGREYLAERGISEDTAELFKLGYAPAPTEAGWDRLAREIQAAKLPVELAEQLGLVARSERTGNLYDRFRGRLMFPIALPGGAVIGFSGRVVPRFAVDDNGEKAPKYVNSPESLLYKKSRSLFGLDIATAQIRTKRRVILVEGNVDVVMMHQRGYGETVAPLGTALTAEQCELLARFADIAILCFDGDRAGAKAMRAALPVLLDAGIEPRVVPLAEGEDPDSADPATLAARLERPVPGLEWFMRRMVAAGATESIDAQSRAVRALVPLLKRVRGRDVRGDYAVLAANLLNVPTRRIWSAIERGAGGPPGDAGGSPGPNAREGRGNRTNSDFHPPSSVPHSAPMRPQPLPRGQLAVTALLIDRPEVARVAERAGALDKVQDARLAPILRRVIEAALGGESQPSEGALLDLTEADPRLHRFLHQRVFAGSYLDADDPQALLDQALMQCGREAIEAEIARIETESVHARQLGDEELLRKLQLEKVQLRKQQAELRQQQIRA